jgi:hypothetical protein
MPQAWQLRSFAPPDVRAVAIYERLGFCTRMAVHFTALKKVSEE